MAETKPFFQRIARGAVVSAYGAAAAWFLWVCAQFYLPGQGFTYLVMFGDRDAARFVPELKAVNHYELPNSVGYDGANYAQIAMHPRLGDPVLRDAIDSVPYRARRILFSWLAYALAFGDPARALHIFAVENIVCWLLLAVLMLRWFPATSWGNFVRWAGVLYSFGLCFSVRGALVDGPSLLLIAAGVALAEAGRPWWSAAVLGISGLGKETNILAGTALAPATSSSRAWLRAAAQAAVIVLPLAVWLAILHAWLGEAMDSGYRNFAAPFAGYVGKWKELLAGFQKFGPAWEERGGLAVLLAVTAQFLFFALRPRWRETWWRVGAAYALLMAALGEAVWEGYPGAASRVLLPMALAFNILLPRGWRWWPVLLVGNLTILVTPDTLQPPPRDSYEIDGPRALRIAEGSGQAAKVSFDDGWYGPERSRREFWEWSRGPAVLTIRNPQPFAIRANVSFGLRAHGERSIRIRQGTRELWHGNLQARELKAVKLAGVRLEPGDNRWEFGTDKPGAPPDNGDVRSLAFSLRNLRIELTGAAPAPD